MERNDIYRPSVIQPTEYQAIAFDYVGPHFSYDTCEFIKRERKVVTDHQAISGGERVPAHAGTCNVCGASAFYLVVFYHANSNTYIRTGEDCAEKMHMGYDKNGFSVFHHQVRDAIELQAGLRKAEAVLDAAGLDAAFELYMTGGFVQYEERTICDIVSKLVKYGSISEKQESFIRNLLAKIDNRAVVEAQKAQERAEAMDCPSGRIIIEGTVLGLKTQDSQFGPVTKMLVQHDSGFKVYGTRPSHSGFEKGMRVRFTASVEQSDKDSKFGFYKRPTNAEVIQAEVAHA